MNGCLTLTPVLNPIFSAFSISAKVVPFDLHSLMKLLISRLFFSSFLTIGWSAATATKLAPKSVSGLVVKTSIVLQSSSGAITISNLNCKPVDFPIQLFCIVLTFSGHLLSLSSLLSKSFA